MIHPETELRLVNPQVGHGVFATGFIPKGSLVYVQDPLDIEITVERYQGLDSWSRAEAEKYSYIDPRGVRILSWDAAKFVNHSCSPNTMSTAWGFEIALRDIHVGEEITDEYGLFNLEWEMECGCGQSACRRMIRPTDSSRMYRRWDRWVRSALQRVKDVPQPLISLLDEDARRSLDRYLAGGSRYRSVRHLLRLAAADEHRAA